MSIRVVISNKYIKTKIDKIFMGQPKKQIYKSFTIASKKKQITKF